jgi:hypothetical protein
MSIRRLYWVALGLFMVNLPACGGARINLPGGSQPSKVISERMFKESCQSVAGCDLTKAPRLVVRSYAMEPMAIGVKSGSAAGDVAAGAAAGAAWGAMQAAGAAAAAVPGGMAAAMLMSAIIPGSEDRSDDFARELKEVLPGQACAEQASARVEAMLKSRTKSEILTEFHALSRRGTVPTPSQAPYLAKDAVLNLTYIIWFADQNPKMIIVLNWHLVVDYTKKQELSARMQAINWKDRKNAQVEWTKIMAEYGGQGQFAYTSPAYSPQEWLADNGNLLQEEYDQALGELARRLEGALFSGRAG